MKIFNSIKDKIKKVFEGKPKSTMSLTIFLTVDGKRYEFYLGDYVAPSRSHARAVLSYGMDKILEQVNEGDKK